MLLAAFAETAGGATRLDGSSDALSAKTNIARADGDKRPYHRAHTAACLVGTTNRRGRLSRFYPVGLFAQTHARTADKQITAVTAPIDGSAEPEEPTPG